jgi:hypothetical protein
MTLPILDDSPFAEETRGFFSAKAQNTPSFPPEFRFLVVRPEDKHDIPMGKV